MTKDLRPSILRVTRPISFLLVLGITLLYGIEDSKLKFFFYMTHWGMILSTLYFLLSLDLVHSLYHDYLAPFFHLIWAFNWGITFAFWCVIFPLAVLDQDLFRGTSCHSLPLLLTLIEFALTTTPIERKRYIIPIVVYIIYSFGFLIPYSLIVEPVYTGMTFIDIYSYLFLLSIVIVGMSSLELGRFIRSLGKHEKSDIEMPLVN